MLISVLVGLLVLLLIIAFVSGRKYERKQFVRIGKKRPTVQDILLRKPRGKK